jgi:hypothetical protein
MAMARPRATWKGTTLFVHLEPPFDSSLTTAVSLGRLQAFPAEPLLGLEQPLTTLHSEEPDIHCQSALVLSKTMKSTTCMMKLTAMSAIIPSDPKIATKPSRLMISHPGAGTYCARSHPRRYLAIPVSKNVRGTAWHLLAENT